MEVRRLGRELWAFPLPMQCHSFMKQADSPGNRPMPGSPCSKVFRPLHTFQGLCQVGHQVVDVLKSHGQTHRSVCDALFVGFRIG